MKGELYPCILHTRRLKRDLAGISTFSQKNCTRSRGRCENEKTAKQKDEWMLEHEAAMYFMSMHGVMRPALSKSINKRSEFDSCINADYLRVSLPWGLHSPPRNVSISSSFLEVKLGGG